MRCRVEVSRTICMISQKMRDKWAEEDKKRLEEYLEVAKKAGIPKEDILKMFDEINAKEDALVENLDKAGFFDGAKA